MSKKTSETLEGLIEDALTRAMVTRLTPAVFERLLSNAASRAVEQVMLDAPTTAIPPVEETHHAVATAKPIKGGTKWQEMSPKQKAKAVVRGNKQGTTTTDIAKNVGATETALRAFVWKHKLSGKTTLPKSFS